MSDDTPLNHYGHPLPPLPERVSNSADPRTEQAKAAEAWTDSPDGVKLYTPDVAAGVEQAKFAAAGHTDPRWKPKLNTPIAPYYSTDGRWLDEPEILGPNMSNASSGHVPQQPGSGNYVPQKPGVLDPNHPYYNQGGFEALEVIEAFKLNWHLGNVIKYVLRAEKKGHREADLRKALWYLQREVDQLPSSGNS